MQTQIIIRSPSSSGAYDPGLGFSIGGLVKSVGSAVKSVASSSVSAVSSAAHAVGSGVATIAKTGVTLVSTVAKVGCGTVQAANRAVPLVSSVPSPYAATGAAVTSLASRVCSMAYPPPASPAVAPASGVDPYASAPVMTVVNAGPTAPDPTVVSTAYPQGTIYTRDARRPGTYRVAVPIGTLAGLGSAATHAEIATTAAPPSGGTEVTPARFVAQIGQGGILRDYRFWLAVGGVVAAGGATAVHLHRRQR